MRKYRSYPKLDTIATLRIRADIKGVFERVCREHLSLNISECIRFLIYDFLMSVGITVEDLEEERIKRVLMLRKRVYDEVLIL